jgi:hypothetical protein
VGCDEAVELDVADPGFAGVDVWWPQAATETASVVAATPAAAM